MGIHTYVVGCISILLGLLLLRFLMRSLTAVAASVLPGVTEIPTRR